MQLSKSFHVALVAVACIAQVASEPLYMRVNALAQRLTEARDAAFTSDFFDGTRRKEDESRLPNHDLTYTRENGEQYFQPLGAQRAGERGPLLLQDAHLVDLLAHFNRERIPERIVHARGAGAHGYFEVTSDFASRYSAADVFKPGTRTSVSMRFSTVGGPRGSADEARDPRGVAIKMRTKQGILDWVFNNTPVFFIRDPAKFPRFIHTQKTRSDTNTRDWSIFWAWPAQFPEALLQFLRLFSDLGTPYGFRHMNAWSGHTYKLVAENGTWVYARVYLETEQGVKNFTNAEAQAIAGKEDTFATQDLFDNIANGTFPAWRVGIAIKTPAEAAAYRYDVLDLTKDWPDAKYETVGRIVLTQNPANYFEEIEQAHFSPANTVPGWAPSDDPVLQSRLFAYNDAGRYRLGPNYNDIPVNCPFSSVANYDRDGPGSARGNQGARPNFPYDADALRVVPQPGTALTPGVAGNVTFFESRIAGDIDYEQPRMFHDQMSATDKDHLYSNIGGTLVNVRDRDVLDKLFAQFGKVSPVLEKGVRDAFAQAQKSYEVYRGCASGQFVFR